MTLDQKALETMIAKEDIRELAMLYSRGVDRKDGALLRTLYTKDATDTHGDTFDGSAEDYIQFLERAFPHMRFAAHNICNHLICVNGDEGDGELYALGYTVVPDRKGGWLEDFTCVRYIDNYRKEDGRWRFAKRVVTYDYRTSRPVAGEHPAPIPENDPTYSVLKSRLFARGTRA